MQAIQKNIELKLETIRVDFTKIFKTRAAIERPYELFFIIDVSSNLFLTSRMSKTKVFASDKVRSLSSILKKYIEYSEISIILDEGISLNEPTLHNFISDIKKKSLPVIKSSYIHMKPNSSLVLEFVEYLKENLFSNFIEDYNSKQLASCYNLEMKKFLKIKSKVEFKEENKIDLENQERNQKKKRKLLTPEEKVLAKEQARARAKAKKFDHEWIKEQDALILKEREEAAAKLNEKESPNTTFIPILTTKKEPQIGDIGPDGTPITGFLWGEPVTEKQIRLGGVVTGGTLPPDEEAEVNLAIEKEKRAEENRSYWREYYKNLKKRRK